MSSMQQTAILKQSLNCPLHKLFVTSQMFRDYCRHQPSNGIIRLEKCICVTLINFLLLIKCVLQFVIEGKLFLARDREIHAPTC